MNKSAEGMKNWAFGLGIFVWTGAMFGIQTHHTLVMTVTLIGALIVIGLLWMYSNELEKHAASLAGDRKYLVERLVRVEPKALDENYVAGMRVDTYA